jgi:hypothetical protein
MRRCRRSSQSRLRSTSCSRFQARACLTPSPFGRGVRNSKRFSGLFSGALTVRGEGCGSMDAELSEHGCDVRSRGGGCDRSRNKGVGRGGQGSESGEVDDGDRGVDSDRGVDGKLL